MHSLNVFLTKSVPAHAEASTSSAFQQYQRPAHLRHIPEESDEKNDLRDSKEQIAKLKNDPDEMTERRGAFSDGRSVKKEDPVKSEPPLGNICIFPTLSFTCRRRAGTRLMYVKRHK